MPTWRIWSRKKRLRASTIHNPTAVKYHKSRMGKMLLSQVKVPDWSLLRANRAPLLSFGQIGLLNLVHHLYEVGKGCPVPFITPITANPSVNLMMTQISMNHSETTGWREEDEQPRFLRDDSNEQDATTNWLCITWRMHACLHDNHVQVRLDIRQTVTFLFFHTLLKHALLEQE